MPDKHVPLARGAGDAGRGHVPLPRYAVLPGVEDKFGDIDDEWLAAYLAGQ